MQALPKALAARGHRVMVVAPRYKEYPVSDHSIHLCINDSINQSMIRSVNGVINQSRWAKFDVDGRFTRRSTSPRPPSSCHALQPCLPPCVTVTSNK